MSTKLNLSSSLCLVCSRIASKALTEALSVNFVLDFLSKMGHSNLYSVSLRLLEVNQTTSTAYDLRKS